MVFNELSQFISLGKLLLDERGSSLASQDPPRGLTHTALERVGSIDMEII